MAELRAEDLQKTVVDSFYVAVGLGVIAFQKAQVRRNELQKQFETNNGAAVEALTDTLKTVDERATAVEERIDAVLDDVATRLPAPVADVMKGVRAASKDARAQLRSAVGIA